MDWRDLLIGFAVGAVVGVLVAGILIGRQVRSLRAQLDRPVGERRVLRPEPAPAAAPEPVLLVPPAERDPWRPVGALGSGSADPLPDGASPHPDFVLKAETSTMRYWLPGSVGFEEVTAELWFDSETTARSFGFEPAE